jgi:DUF917 family protein
MRLDAPTLHAVARGCALLAAGGEGDLWLGALMAERAVAEHGPPPVVGVDALPDDALLMPCGLIGAPTVAAERVVSGDEGAALRDEVERLRGAPVAALMAFQLAGANGLLPIIWAARSGLPVVDADGAGRAFPWLYQQAMHLHGIPAAPIVLNDGRGNTIVVHAADDRWADRLGRAAAASLGGASAAAFACLTAEQARSAAITGSLSRARELGMALGTDGLERRLDGLGRLGWTTLLDGKVLDVQRQADGASLRGWAILQGIGAGAARRLRLELQHEFLLAIEDGEVRAVVPDLIAVLAGETGGPVATEALRRGQRVVAVASPGPPLWTSAAGLEQVGPGSFGYDVAYAPIRGSSHGGS